MSNNKQKGVEKMDKVDIVKTVFRDFCPYCHKEISSEYENQVKFNMNVHISVCDQNPSNKENVKN